MATSLANCERMAGDFNVACISSTLARNSLGTAAESLPRQVARGHFEDCQHDAELNRGRLHPRRASDSHRPGREIDFFDARILNHFAAAFDVFAKDVIGIVINEINFRADLDALPCRANDKRRLAAFGDGEYHIVLDTPKSAICFLPNAVKSSKPSTDLMSAKSPPAITLNVRFS